VNLLTADFEARQRALQRPSFPEDVLELQHAVNGNGPSGSRRAD
jgi:hypothetical protein